MWRDVQWWERLPLDTDNENLLCSLRSKGCVTQRLPPISLCLQFTRTFHDFYKWLFLVSHFPFRFRTQSTVFVSVFRSILSWIANEQVSLDLEKMVYPLCFGEGTSTLPGNTSKCSVFETCCADVCLPHLLRAESVPCEAPLLFFLRNSSRHAAPCHHSKFHNNYMFLANKARYISQHQAPLPIQGRFV